MRFDLISKSGRIRHVDLMVMAQAIMHLVNDNFARAWGKDIVTIIATNNASAHAVPCLLVDDVDADTLGAIADREDLGGPPIVIDINGAVLAAGGDIFDDKGTGVSVVAALSHEIMEAMVDTLGGDWVQMPDGRFIAKEVSDPVQSPLVPVKTERSTFMLSNGVLPSYFDPNAKRGPFDLLGVVRAPFELLDQGYQIIFDPKALDAPEGPVTNVWGSGVSKAVKGFKERPAARSWKRAQELLKRLGLRPIERPRGTGLVEPAPHAVAVPAGQ